MKSILLISLLIICIPEFGSGQINCKNEQIELLKLDLKPTFKNFSVIEIKCSSSKMKLNFKTYEIGGTVKLSELHEIPNELYNEFKELILPLGIQSMQGHENFYLLDGLTAEITFLDRFGNFNKFEVRVPMKKNATIFLINTIIALAEKLKIDKAHRKYLDEIKKWYFSY